MNMAILIHLPIERVDIEKWKSVKKAILIHLPIVHGANLIYVLMYELNTEDIRSLNSILYDMLIAL